MLGIIHEVILLSMIFLALIIVEEDDLLNAVVELALLSTFLIVIMFQLKAPDVALSAAVIGALLIGTFIYTIEGVKKSKNG
ncbi:MAG: hydrogenase subunit MbhD domain-containing protein [Thermoplasmatota archaeon]